MARPVLASPWIPVSQVESEFQQLLNLYGERQPQRVLEIGVAFGGTLFNWVTFAPAGALVAYVDLMEHEGVSHETFSAWRDDIDLRGIEGDSTDPQIAQRVREVGPFEWVFIDGSHALADVTSDWENYGAMVEHGIIAFHDIATHDGSHGPSEVPTLWEEVRAGPCRTEEFVEDSGQGWGGIGVVYVG